VPRQVAGGAIRELRRAAHGALEPFGRRCSRPRRFVRRTVAGLIDSWVAGCPVDAVRRPACSCRPVFDHRADAYILGALSDPRQAALYYGFCEGRWGWARQGAPRTAGRRRASRRARPRARVVRARCRSACRARSSSRLPQRRGDTIARSCCGSSRCSPSRAGRTATRAARSCDADAGRPPPRPRRGARPDRARGHHPRKRRSRARNGRSLPRAVVVNAARRHVDRSASSGSTIGCSGASGSISCPPERRAARRGGAIWGGRRGCAGSQGRRDGR
jgi:hypothetical protein